MKEETINKIKDCSVEFGTGMGIILGVCIFSILNILFRIQFTNQQSIVLSLIFTLLFAGLISIKGLFTRKKLKSEGDWHEKDVFGGLDE